MANFKSDYGLDRTWIAAFYCEPNSWVNVIVVMPDAITPKNTFIRNVKDVLRTNLWPALCLQAVSIVLFISYYYWPAGRQGLELLGTFKKSAGLWFVFLASSFSGAVLPYFFQFLQHGNHRRIPATAVWLLVVFYGLRGWLIDGFYTLQAQVWGDNAAPAVLIVKVLCDLVIFSPLIAVPTVLLIYRWIDSGMQWQRFRSQFSRSWTRNRLWTAVQMNWLIWLPALVVLYSLPVALQFPVQVIIQCFWALVLVVMTDKRAA